MSKLVVDTRRREKNRVEEEEEVKRSYEGSVMYEMMREALNKIGRGDIVGRGELGKALSDGIRKSLYGENREARVEMEEMNSVHSAPRVYLKGKIVCTKGKVKGEKGEIVVGVGMEIESEESKGKVRRRKRDEDEIMDVLGTCISDTRLSSLELESIPKRLNRTPGSADSNSGTPLLCYTPLTIQFCGSNTPDSM